MMNFNFNSMNAQDVADKIIAAEEAYVNTDFESLSFEDKCTYALELTPILHPGVAPSPQRRRALLDNLRPELLRRAEKDDAFALYVLGNVSADLSTLATEEERVYLERAVELSYYPAAFSLLNLFYYGKKRDSERAKSLLEWLSECDKTNFSVEDFYAYYIFLGDKEKAAAMALELVFGGVHIGLTYHINRARETFGVDSKEFLFFKEVDTLVANAAKGMRQNTNK